VVGILFLLFLGKWSAAEIIFPANDPWIMEKKAAIAELEQILSGQNALEPVLKSTKVILWANGISGNHLGNADPSTELTVPSFVPITETNRDPLRIEMEQKCQCSLMGREIAGILVAHPFQAAEMYFKEGWSKHKANEIDGVVPPIVIIYHELGHASDFLRDANSFFDLASMWDNRWKNQAEQSAVQHQNELVLALAATKGLRFSLRRSYGKNRLYFVKDIYSVEEIR
jgi:hypothetical protein